MRTVSATGLSAWFRIVSSSWKPVGDGPLPDHRQLRVDVDGARPRHEEEAGLEVLQVVDRERVEALSVHREHPAGEEARVVREEPGRVRQRRLDVSARVAHDERVAVEDLHEPVVHAAARFRREDSLGPERVAACARAAASRPRPRGRREGRPRRRSPSRRAILSKTALSARMTQSACDGWRVTTMSPLSIVTYQRSVFRPRRCRTACSHSPFGAGPRGRAQRAPRRSGPSDRPGGRLAHSHHPSTPSVLRRCGSQRRARRPVACDSRTSRIPTSG